MNRYKDSATREFAVCKTCKNAYFDEYLGIKLVRNGDEEIKWSHIL